MRFMKMQLKFVPAACAIALLMSSAAISQPTENSKEDSAKAVMHPKHHKTHTTCPVKKENNINKTDTTKKTLDVKGDTTAKAANTGYWTCSMHPEIHKTEAGNCPICGMKLEFKKNEKDTVKTKETDHCKMKM